MLSPPPAPPAGPSGLVGDPQGAGADAEQERESSEVQGRAPEIGGTGLGQSHPVTPANAGPQVSWSQGSPSAADQGAESRGSGVCEASESDSRVLGAKSQDQSTWDIRAVKSGGQGKEEEELEAKAEAKVVEIEEQETQKPEAGRSGMLQTETQRAGPELQGTPSSRSEALRTATVVAESGVSGSHENGLWGSRVPETETEIRGAQEKEVGAPGVLGSQESAVTGAQEPKLEHAGGLRLEAERTDATILGTQEVAAGGSEAPGADIESAGAQGLGTQEPEDGDSRNHGAEGELSGSQLLGGQETSAAGLETEAASDGVQETKVGASGPEAEGLGTHPTEIKITDAQEVKAETVGVYEAETGLGGPPRDEAAPRTLFTKHGVLEPTGVDGTVLRAPEVEAGDFGVSETEPGASGAQEGEREVPGLPEGHTGVSEPQEAESGALDTPPEASGIGAQVAHSPEEAEEDGQPPGSQVGQDARARCCLSAWTASCAAAPCLLVFRGAPDPCLTSLGCME